ncbi:hypothetical protein FC697_02075 [Bacillus wiedmannii]|uniref:hypothetical protein n=1 Tax=Bacillus wiedmannii TaxID=1890302 RepID=UPI0010BD52B3|nr:hypothetical protein [Bacillus wiedmannii]TKH26871.1 hypothetical protein FC697_02075 [Bacillus wiedmannii]
MEAARSECEGDGASDVEALFASQEEVKPPNILAAGTRLKKVEVACSERDDAKATNGSNKGL